MARRNLMIRHGLTVLSVSPSQLRDDPKTLTTTLHAALATGAAGAAPEVRLGAPA